MANKLYGDYRYGLYPAFEKAGISPDFVLKIGVPNPEEYHLEVGKAVLIRKTIFRELHGRR